MADLRKEHGVPNQINVYQLDKDSVITSYGKHWRVLGFWEGSSVTARCDSGVGVEPTDSEILSVLRKTEYIKGRGWRVAERTYYPSYADFSDCFWVTIVKD